MRKLFIFIVLSNLIFFSYATEAAISVGTTIKTRTADPIDSSVRKAGYEFRLTIENDIKVKGKAVIKSGSKARAIITKIKPSGKGLDEAMMILTLVSIKVNNRTRNVQSFPIAGKAKSNKRSIVGNNNIDNNAVVDNNGGKITADIPVKTKGYDIILPEGSVLYFILKEPITF